MMLIRRINKEWATIVFLHYILVAGAKISPPRCTLTVRNTGLQSYVWQGDELNNITRYNIAGYQTLYDVPCKKAVHYSCFYSGTLEVAYYRPPVYFPAIHVWIPLTKRPGNVKYIEKTLDSWSMVPNAQINILNLDYVHIDYERSKRIRIIDAPRTQSQDKIYQQKLDVIKMLRYSLLHTDAGLIMVAEDDFPPCESLKGAISEIFTNNIFGRSFSSIITAVGMNGMIFQRVLVPKLIKYLKSGLDRNKQVDHMTHEWLLKETEQAKSDLAGFYPVTTQVMHFRHTGVVSNFGHRHNPTSFQCGDSMKNAHFPGLNYDDSREAVASYSV